MNLFIHCFDFYIAEYVSVNASLHLKFHPLHPNITRHNYSPYCSLNIFQGTDKENLFNNQELLKLMIISFILLIIKFDPEMMLQRGIRCYI